MVDIAKDLQDKWGFGLIDLLHNEEINSISDELRAKYIASDGIHPTALGYREWWGHFDGVSRILGHCEPHICPVMVFPAGPITHARK